MTTDHGNPKKKQPQLSSSSSSSLSISPKHKNFIDHYLIYNEIDKFKKPAFKRVIYVETIQRWESNYHFGESIKGFNPISINFKSNPIDPSFCLAFIEFQEENESIKCRTFLENNYYKVFWAVPISTLYVTNIDPNMKRSVVMALFSHFGELETKECVFINNYGFIRYTKSYDAEKALAKLNGFKFGERNLKVKWSDSCDQRTSIHITFDVNSGNIPEGFHQMVCQKCQQFGKIKHYNIPRDAKTGVYEGYGFIHFKDSENGEMASQSAMDFFNNNNFLSNVNIQCSFSKKKSTSYKSFIIPPKLNNYNINNNNINNNNNNINNNNNNNNRSLLSSSSPPITISQSSPSIYLFSPFQSIYSSHTLDENEVYSSPSSSSSSSNSPSTSPSHSLSKNFKAICTIGDLFNADNPFFLPLLQQQQSIVSL
ncbi:hypothetical protein DFA_07298 [Cavenderia fasciculata]|uniref:RRM domain-containing protein n=1 Tax=Cavenderia fasciculata TaxID=261658 RepID=F4PW14_CACFS|nr:uncharacterized protein DFA_07298 [Cavenderia fasciculata]EGG20178.1 hypothetical protein DFA_07298 [Cavenderia fasciculata]|eukprot:XP_004367161.1 hypothetical protein DFA_07298 [Cavenderia fasciculata]